MLNPNASEQALNEIATSACVSNINLYRVLKKDSQRFNLKTADKKAGACSSGFFYFPRNTK